MKNIFLLMLASFSGLFLMACSSDADEPNNAGQDKDISSGYLTCAEWPDVIYGQDSPCSDILDVLKSKEINLTKVEGIMHTGLYLGHGVEILLEGEYQLDVPLKGATFTLYKNLDSRIIAYREEVGHIFRSEPFTATFWPHLAFPGTDSSSADLFYIRYDSKAGEKFDCRREMKTPYGVCSTGKDKFEVSISSTERPREFTLVYDILPDQDLIFRNVTVNGQTTNEISDHRHLLNSLYLHVRQAD